MEKNIELQDDNDLFKDVFNENKEKIKITLKELLISAMRKLCENDRTYNEEGDEEEEFGFKKVYYYNNENFWR